MLPSVFALLAQDDNSAQVTDESANLERPLCRSKHELKGRCWEQNVNWGHLHRHEKCWTSRMCFLLQWCACVWKWQIRKKAHLTKWRVSAVLAQDDNCAQVTSESANSDRPMCRSKHELRGRCWEQNMNRGHLHRYEKCWKSKMCFLLQWGAWF